MIERSVTPLGRVDVKAFDEMWNEVVAEGGPVTQFSSAQDRLASGAWTHLMRARTRRDGYTAETAIVLTGDGAVVVGSVGAGERGDLQDVANLLTEICGLEGATSADGPVRLDPAAERHVTIDSVEEFLDGQVEYGHFVVVSRQDPPIHVLRWVRGEDGSRVVGTEQQPGRYPIYRCDETYPVVATLTYLIATGAS